MKIALALPVLILASLASAATIYDRSLDPTHLTTQSPSGPGFIVGDDMGFRGFSRSGTINALTVWIVAQGGNVTNPNQEFSAINLYLGVEPAALTKVSSSYTFAPSGLFSARPIFALTFAGLSFNFPVNIPIDFAVEGINTSGIKLNLASLTPGGACPGGPFNNDPAPTSCDQVSLVFQGPAGTGPYNLSFTPLGSDVNVLVTGTFAGTVPEPSTFALFGIGAAALLFVRRRA